VKRLGWLVLLVSLSTSGCWDGVGTYSLSSGPESVIVNVWTGEVCTVGYSKPSDDWRRHCERDE